jgi:diaminopimelate epimerase
MSAGVLRLTKHHGLGNDFLVLLDPVAGLDGAALARRVCDRHRGIGADGLLIAHPGTDGADVTMELRNADGTRAEMSGNGIRCLAQALWDAGLSRRADEVTVATDAGVRVVRLVDSHRSGYLRAAVDMGPVKVVHDAPQYTLGSVEAAAFVDAGNPHLVLLDPELAAVDVPARGAEIDASFPGGINVEWVWPGPGPGELTLRVWERGAGETEACGTGSCAAAAAALSWARVGPRVVVHNPGGDVTVELRETAVLTGPAARVASVEMPWP